MNTAQAMPWWGWLFFAGFFLLLGLTGVMFVSILRQGDERRRLILLHAGSTSFSAFVGMLLLEIILGVTGSITQGIPIEEKNPLVLLMTAALVYCVSLCYYKRRYGD